MTPRLRKLLLAAHVTFSVGWLGAVNITKIGFDTKTRDKTNISIDGVTTGAFTFGSVTLPTA